MKRNIFQPLGFAALTVTALTANAWAQSGAGTGTGSSAGSNSTSGANTGNNSGSASGGASGGASGNTGRNAGGTSGGTGTATGGLQGHGTGNQQNMNMQRGSGAGGPGMMSMQGMPGMAGMLSPLMPAPLQQASDQLFALKASQGNSAEVATSQLAVAKSQDARVRQFAERMIADHTRANDELTPLGARAGVVLPKPPGVMQHATARLLQTLEGAEFDRQYLAGQVEAHENSVTLFHHEALHGQDPQLRAYANRYLPALIGHTSMVYGLARDLNVPGIGERPLAMLTSPGMMTMPGMAGMHGTSATGGTGGSGGSGGTSAGFNQGGNQGGGQGIGSIGGQSRGGTGGGTGIGGSGGQGGQGSGGTGGSGAGSSGAGNAGGTGTGGLGGTR